MQILDAIETQMICNRLPLVAITVSAVPCCNTPIVLALHWHGLVERALPIQATDDDAPAVETVCYEPVPSSCLQITQRWDRVTDLDCAIIEVAWELGAWNLRRTEARPFLRPGAPTAEVFECEMVFGRPEFLHDGLSPAVSEVPDADDLVEAAGRMGYLFWQFHPVRGGVWNDVGKDLTLERGGYRNPSCPADSVPVENPQSLRRSRQIVYEFGKLYGEPDPAMPK